MSTSIKRYGNNGLVTYRCYLLPLLYQFLIYSVGANEKAILTHKYLDNEENILRLRCDGICLDGKGYYSTSIYNATTNQDIVLWKLGEPAAISKPFLPQISFYVPSCLDTSEKSVKELVITNVGILELVVVGCNITCVGQGTAPTASTSLTIVGKGQSGQTHNISTKTLIILIIVIIVLSLMVVFSLALWLRARRQLRVKVLYQTSSQSKIRHNSYADSFSGDSISRSPSKISVRKSSDPKIPTINGSVRRVTSRSESNITTSRGGHHLPPPPAPPKIYWETQPIYSSQTSAGSIGISYVQPKDAIEPDFSEDGDVTSGNSDIQQGYSMVSGHRPNKQNASFYSSVPVRSVDAYTTAQRSAEIN